MSTGETIEQNTFPIDVTIPEQSSSDTSPESEPTSPIPVLPELGMALGLLVLVFGVTYIGTTGKVAHEPSPDTVRVDRELTESTNKALSLASVFEDTTLRAKSAIVWDVKNQRVLFNKNADAELPLASITKLMTALVVYELLDPEDYLTISLSALKADGDSGFVDGESFTMQNLTDLTLISSSNDGAMALSENAGNAISTQRDPEETFVRAMNLKADELGLTKTTFKNSTGLDLSPEEAGAFGSARDVALLMEYIITHATDAVALTNLDITTIENEDGAYHLAKNTNDVVNNINGLIASKTGYTVLAGGNLVIAFDAGLNRPIVAVVLGSSEQGRFDDMLDLVKRTRLYIESSLK